jgi:hypothetical protein
MVEQTDTPPKTTKGESRVRVTFNPSGNQDVDEIKAVAAALIDRCGSVNLPKDEEKQNEQKRLIALAQTAAEEAAMWGVKAATI